VERVPELVDPLRKILVAAAHLIRPEGGDLPQRELLGIVRTTGRDVPTARNTSRRSGTSAIASRAWSCSNSASRDGQGIDTVLAGSSILTSSIRRPSIGRLYGGVSTRGLDEALTPDSSP
jgi:hypothetical protein